MKVLMIGPARSVRGGVSAVVNNYYKAGLDLRVELKYLGTMEDGSRLHKLFVAIRALFQFVFTVFRYELVHINMASDVSLYRKLPFIWLTRIFGKKLIIHQHGGDFERFFYSQCSTRKQRLIKRSLNWADQFIVVAPYLKKIFSDIVDENKIIVLQNAIEVPKEVTPHYGGFKLLFLGRLCLQKGIRELLEAVEALKEEFPGLQLYLGGVWEDDSLKQLADGMGDYVKQPGWIGNEEKEKVLRDCNIFVLPTYFEGMPMSLLEAMAYGLACVASDVGGIPQVVANGREGILVPPGDWVCLYETLKKLLQNPGRQKELGENGRKRIQHSFDLKKNVESLLEIYLSTMSD